MSGLERGLRWVKYTTDPRSSQQIAIDSIWATKTAQDIIRRRKDKQNESRSSEPEGTTEPSIV